MVGLGETHEEVLEAMDDLLAHGVDIMTIGQYLQPTKKHLRVERYVHPDEFAKWKEIALQKGFKHCEAGPMVRSSYHADEQVNKAARLRQLEGENSDPDHLISQYKTKVTGTEHPKL